MVPTHQSTSLTPATLLPSKHSYLKKPKENRTGTDLRVELAVGINYCLISEAAISVLSLVLTRIETAGAGARKGSLLIVLHGLVALSSTFQESRPQTTATFRRGHVCVCVCVCSS